MLLLYCLLSLLIGIAETQNCTLPDTFQCNLNKSETCQNSTWITATSNINYTCTYILQLQASQGVILNGGSFTSLYISTKTVIITNSTYIDTILIINATNNIDLIKTSITAKKLFIKSDGNINIQQSTFEIQNISCINKPIKIGDLRENYKKYDFANISSINQSDINLFILTITNVNINQSSLFASFIVIIAHNLNTTSAILQAQGCDSSEGNFPGKAIKYSEAQYCYKGGSTISQGSLNWVNDEVLQYCLSILQLTSFVLKHQSNIANKELISGSGGYAGHKSKFARSAYGGGIIILQINSTYATINTTINVSASNVSSLNNSAGSAGTIFINCQKWQSLVLSEIKSLQLLALGGSSSQTGGAGGAGGLISVWFIEEPNHNSEFIISVNSGQQGKGSSFESNGVVRMPPCHTTFYRESFTCIAIPSNSYTVFGTPIPLPCPVFSGYQSDKEYNTNFESCFSSQNQQKYFEFHLLGHTNLLNLSLYFLSGITFGIIGFIIRSKMKYNKKKIIQQQQIEHIYEYKNQLGIVTDKYKDQKDVKLEQLMYHIHRFDVYGINDDKCPWILSQFIPKNISKYIRPNAYYIFRKQFNKLSHWTKIQQIICKILLLIYPLYWFYCYRIRLNKFKILQQYLCEVQQSQNLLNNYDYQDQQIMRLKLTVSSDLTIIHIDLFMYDYSNVKYFTLTSPFLIHLAGDGSYLTPYYLEINDVFVKILYFIINRNLLIEVNQNYTKQQIFENLINKKQRNKNRIKIIKFIKTFNQLLCSMDMNGTNQYLIKHLNKLIYFINNWNLIFFNQFCTHLDLILMIQQLNDTIVIHNSFHYLKTQQIKLLLYRNGEYLQSFIKEYLYLRNNKRKIKFALFLFNPDQQINKSSSNQTLKNNTNKSKKNNNNNNNNSNINHNNNNTNNNIINNNNNTQIFSVIETMNEINYFQQQIYKKKLISQQQQQQQQQYHLKSNQKLLKNSLLNYQKSYSNISNENQQLSNKQNIKIKIKSNQINNIKKYFIYILRLLRFYAFSHRLTDIDKYFIKLFQSWLILTQLLIFFVWSEIIQYPYIFVNFISPFLGMLWLVSDSYQCGKLFLILNVLNLINHCVAIILNIMLYTFNSQSLITLMSGLTNTIIIILLMIIGSRALIFSHQFTFI